MKWGCARLVLVLLGVLGSRAGLADGDKALGLWHWTKIETKAREVGIENSAKSSAAYSGRWD